MSGINLRKQIVDKIVLSKGLENQKAQVVLCLDYSGSMRELYATGKVQKLVERLIPIAMKFDDNGEMELYMFSNDCKKHKNNITLSNYENFIESQVYNKYSFGGTSYSPTINMIKENFIPTENKKSFFSFNKKNEVTELKDPVYVIFITDGENDDKSYAENAIINASKHPIFFQFVGIGNDSFRFLKKLDDLNGRTVDNANFFQANDIDKMSDEELYEKLLTEFPTWLKEVKSKNILK